jgi:hypothetical protein
MTPQGVTTVTDPVSSSSRQRESEVEKKFAAIEKEYGRSKYLTHRRDSMKLRAGPKTPVSDEYVTVIRSRTPAQERREMLDQLVIREEQFKRGQWLQEEEIRAAVLPYQLRQERQFLAQAEYNAKVSQEYDAARRERQAAVAEAQKYGYDSPEALQQAIQEEKAIRRANELGLALTEAQLIAQTVAREGYSGAAIQYGRDPQELIAEQAATAKAAQYSLEQNFEMAADPRHQGFFKEASDFTALHREAAGTAQPRTDSLVDNQLGLRLTKAGPALKTSDYPAPPAGATAEETPSELEQTLKTHPFLLSPVGQFVQDIFKDQGEIARAESDYDEAYKRYEVRRKAAEEAGLLIDGEFTVSNAASQIQYEELRIAAEATEQFGKKAEGLRKSELFGIPAQFGEFESGLAGALNLPKLTKEQAQGLTKAQELSWAVMPLIGSPRMSPELSEFKAGVLSGAYSGIRDRPLTGIASLGIGFVGGLAMKGAAALPKAGKGLSVGLKGVEGAWVGSVAGRTAIQPGLFSAGETFGGILTTEALPIVAGAGAVKYIPGMSSATRLPRGSDPGIPLARQMVFDVTGEITPPRHVATVGRTKIYGNEVFFPKIRGLARTGGVRVHGTEIDFPFVREVARLGGGRKIYGSETNFPQIREVAEVGGVKIYGSEADFPTIRELGRDSAGVRVFDATGLAEPELVGVVDVAPPRGSGRSRGAQILYTPEALGARQRTIMTNRGVVRAPRRPEAQQLIRPSTTQKTTIASTQAKTSIPEPGSLIGISLMPAAIATTLPKQTPKQDRDIMRVTLPSLTEKRSDPASFTPQTLPKIDQSFKEIKTPTKKSTQTPEQDQPQVKIPAVAVDLALAQEQVTVQIPRIRSPDPVRPRRPRIERPPPPPGIVFPEGLDVGGIGDEFYVHYAERPTPHARLEEAYTNLIGPKIRRARVIENIQRITIGEPPRTPRRAIVSRVGPKVRRARQEVPWDIDLGGMFRSAPKRRKRKRR